MSLGSVYLPAVSFTTTNPITDEEHTTRLWPGRTRKLIEVFDGRETFGPLRSKQFQRETIGVQRIPNGSSLLQWSYLAIALIELPLERSSRG
jgi:hypothetical protein